MNLLKKKIDNDELGRYSIISGATALFLLLMIVLDNSLTNVLPNIFIGILSFVAVYFGIKTYFKKGRGKIMAALGVMLGMTCLLPSSVNLFFPEKTLNFTPGYKDICFLGNTDKIGLRYCSSYNHCYIKHTYDADTDTFIKQDPGNKLDKYTYSRDGKKVLFVDGSENEKNIFIMNTDGSGKRQLTHSSEKDTSIIKSNYGNDSMKVKTNISPSFSPDCRRVIFARYTLMVKKRSGLSRLSDCDIYEVDIKTGVERRLTNYNFTNVSPPHYFSDGKRFIFSGQPKDYKDYSSKYKGNIIFVMDEKNTELKPTIVHSSFSKNPSISFDDKIVYAASYDEATRGENRNQLLMNHGKNTVRLLNKSSKSCEISTDGKRVVLKEERRLVRAPYTEDHFWMVNSDGTGLKELIPPAD